MKTLKLKEDIFWVGSLDPELRVFDIIMETKYGTTYNAYVVIGSEKVALFETVKVKYFDEYLAKLKDILGDLKRIDYIVTNHTEPDHAGSVEKLLNEAPCAKVVGSENAIDFLKEITNRPFDHIIVKHGDTLNLGNKTLKFVNAPFLHWPDSIYTYIPEDKILFTCDSFGAHYSFDEVLYSKIPEEKKGDYYDALLYYYTAIFGPFKKYVLEALDKISGFAIDMVCTGHGPVLDNNPQEIMEIYRRWSTDTYKNVKKTIVIPYVAAYGYTAELTEKIIDGIKSVGDFDIKKYEINISNYGSLKADIMNDIFYADGIMLGTSTINGDALPLIWDIAVSLNPIVHGGKTATAFGSYGWSGEGVPNIIARLDQLRMNVLDGYKARFKPSAKELEGGLEFGKVFAQSILSGTVPPRINETTEEGESLNPTGKVVRWRCTVCGEIIEGILPPKVCPVCGVGPELFEMLEDKSVSFTTDKTMKIAIIGNGAAGITAAESVRLRAPNAEITIISKEKTKAYYRPSISDYLYKNVPDNELYLKDDKWYVDNKIEVIYGETVTAIDTQNKSLALSSGGTKQYDKLIIAGGARCSVPPINNLGLKGVFSLRTLADADAIKEYAKQSKKVIIVGGGVLGLEAGWALKQLGLQVEIIEGESRIFPRQLDNEGSAIFEQILAKEGIIINKGHFVKTLKGESAVTGVELDNEKYISGDMVLISAGIRPNTEIVANTGIKANRGIVVNDRMETSVKDIYACGDIAEYENSLLGLWSPALDQGTVAGANAVGDSLQYKSILHPVTFVGMNTEIFSIGNLGTKDEKYEIAGFTDNKFLKYKKLYFHNSIFVGGVLLGDTSKAATLLKGARNSLYITKVIKALY